jgi:hypothetical protein
LRIKYLHKLNKMGNNNSSNQIQENLEDIALKNFNIRVNSYSYPHHGPYHQYIEWCRAQYQLECIPPSCRQGSNYRTQ